MMSRFAPMGSSPSPSEPASPPKRAIALKNRNSGGRLLSIALLAAGLLSSCEDATSAAPDGQDSIDAQLDRLIELSTELDPTLTSDHHDRQLHARRAYAAKLRLGSEELGRKSLERFLEVEQQSEPAPLQVRLKLLDIAAHTAKAETTPVLESLLLEYGHKIDIRTEATVLLGMTAPERAVELLTPLLKRTKSTSTMPADEFLLKAYVLGCDGTGQDPVPILADVATNIHKDDAARHQAVQELGKHKTRLSQQALRSILVESTGNAYMRRKAAQSIRNIFPREEACAIFELIASREADMHFLKFLGDMIEDNCE